MRLRLRAAPLKLRPTRLRLASLALTRRECRTRLPFRFGIATMTSAPMLVAEVTARTATGAEIRGYAADLLVPKWFDKDPATSHDEDRAALAGAAENAFEHMRASASAGDGLTVGDLWLGAQRELVDASEGAGPPPLVRMFGVALVERALLDAVCRAEGATFEEAVQGDLIGLRGALGRADPATADWTPASLPSPPDRIRVRHTVGLSDDLDGDDLPAGLERVDDHPLTLAEDIAAHGLCAFKVKVSGDAAADLTRLERVAAIAPDGAAFTLDGNEQFERPAEVADLLDALESRGRAAGLLTGLRAIEQPVPRAATLDPAHAADVARLSERAPVIIDEADATLDALPRALDLGYGGVSVKACKGVMRALLSRARLEARGAGLQSGEDLTNLPTMPLLQDLALARLLALPDVERNGHHYFRGTDHLAAAERDWLLGEHSDLFAGTPPRLSIEDGSVSLRSIGAARGFGYAGPVAASADAEASS